MLIRPITCFALAAFFACSSLQALDWNRQESTARTDELREATQHSDRHHQELSILIASALSREAGLGTSMYQLAAASEQIRLLSHKVQQAKINVLSLKLDKANSANQLVPDAVSREEIRRLEAQNLIAIQQFQQMRLASLAKSAKVQSQIAKSKLLVAKLDLELALLSLRGASRFPPQTISEEEYRQIRLDVAIARQRLDALRAGQ